MKLLQLKYFQTVCSLGSITRASALLSVSQPAISAAIKELEREFGVQLFSRVGKSLELTREGQTLLGLSEDLLRRADSAAQVMSDLANQRNRIRLGMPPMLCSILLPQLYGDFTTRFPEVSFEVVEDGRYPLFDKLESGEIDMLIMSEAGNYTAPLKNDYHRLPITELEYSCCVAPGHRLAGCGRVGAADVGADPVVTFLQGYHQQEFIHKMFAEAGLVPNVAFCSGQLSTIWEMVAHSGMVTFLYRALSRQRPDLRFIPLQISMPVRISLFWRLGDFLYSDMNKLIRCVRELRL